MINGSEREVETPRLRQEGHEAALAAEREGAAMQRINHDGIEPDGAARADDVTDRVEQQDLAEPASLAAMIGGQPLDDRRRHRIMQQAPCDLLRRQVVFLEARRVQRVVAGESATERVTASWLLGKSRPERKSGSRWPRFPALYRNSGNPRTEKSGETPSPDRTKTETYKGAGQGRAIEMSLGRYNILRSVWQKPILPVPAPQVKRD